MSDSLFLARLLGPIMVVVAVSFLTHRGAIRQIFSDFSHSAGEVHLARVAMMAAGLAIILKKNVWTATWEIVPTLVGWVALVVGVLLALAPHRMIACGKKFAKNAALMTVVPLVVLAGGLWLCAAGYAG